MTMLAYDAVIPSEGAKRRSQGTPAFVFDRHSGTQFQNLRICL